MAISPEDKQDWVIGAIFRMFGKGCIDKPKASKLLKERAGLPHYDAERLAFIWDESISRRFRLGLDYRGITFNTNI